MPFLADSPFDAIMNKIIENLRIEKGAFAWEDFGAFIKTSLIRWAAAAERFIYMIKQEMSLRNSAISPMRIQPLLCRERISSPWSHRRAPGVLWSGFPLSAKTDHDHQDWRTGWRILFFARRQLFLQYREAHHFFKNSAWGLWDKHLHKSKHTVCWRCANRTKTSGVWRENRHVLSVGLCA